jgi:rRNA maturation RNase YbeY
MAPAVWVRNFQSAVVVKELLLKLHSTFLLHVLGAGGYDVNFVCMGDAEIQKLNKRYRKVDSATDVLSFPYHENLKPGHLPSVRDKWDSNLGDIILGVSVIERECAFDGVQLRNRLPVIVTHGLCHLAGYHHDDERSTKLMYGREKSMLTQFNSSFGTDLSPLTEAALP